MPVAVIARLDDVGAAQVEFLIEALPDRPVHSRPVHIRLATHDDESNVVGLDDALARATQTWKKLAITLVGIGVFPGEPPGLWLVPIPIGELLRWHMAVDETLVGAAGRHCYEHGIWTPYVSLGQTAFPGDAIEVLTAHWQEPIWQRRTGSSLSAWTRSRSSTAIRCPANSTWVDGLPAASMGRRHPVEAPLS